MFEFDISANTGMKNETKKMTQERSFILKLTLELSRDRTYGKIKGMQVY